MVQLSSRSCLPSQPCGVDQTVMSPRAPRTDNLVMEIAWIGILAQVNGADPDGGDEVAAAPRP